MLLAWSLFGLTIETSRLCLRLPSDTEIVELAMLAADGVHPPDEQPFLTPWTEGTREEQVHFVLQQHWGGLGSWSAESWCLGLGVFHAGTPIGLVELRAKRFSVVREVTTSSWLGLAHQGAGLATEAREGLLALAFDHLEAQAALTEVCQNNHASQGVSRKLGYQPDGISTDRRGDEAVVSDRLRLTRQKWLASDRPAISVAGVEHCRSMFGV